MGEIQEAISSGECQETEVRSIPNLSRRPQTDRCGSQSEVGASKEPAVKEGGIVRKLGDEEAWF